MLINNTIESSKRPGIPGPHRPDLKWFKDALDGKSDVGHVHQKKDITDFEHNHDGRYYRKDEHELQLLLSGNGTPNFNQGINGDYYVDELNGDLYKKSGDAWNLIIHLEGEQGIPGPQGSPGIPGPEGPTGKEGYTPVRGTDYWTPEDEEIIRQSIVSEVQLGLSGKVDKVAGKGLSTEDFTTLLKQKLEELQNYDDRNIRELLEKALYNVTIDVKTGILTFHTIDESSFTIDLPLELIVSDGYLNKDTNTIVLVLANGNTIDIPVENLIKDFYSKSEVDQKIDDLAEEVNAEFDNVDTKLLEAQAQIDALKAENEAQQKELDILYNDLVPGEASGETAVVSNGITGSKVEIDGDGNSYQEVIEEEEGTTVTGEYINVTDVDVNKEHNISIDTNIKQDSREGYNLIDNIATTQTVSGVTFTVNNDKSITIKGTTTSDIASYIIAENITLKAGTYILDTKNKTANFGIYLTKGGANFAYLGMSTNSSNTTFTVEEDTTFTTLHFYTIANKTLDITIYPMIYEGTTVKPYEQYGSMPSIEFPSEIKTPVGKQEVVFGNKNLFDVNDITENTYITDDGYLGSSTVTNVSDFIKVYKGINVYLSYEYNTLLNTTGRSFILYDKNKNAISGGNYSPSDKKRIFTPLEDGYIRFAYDKNCYDIQVEYGDVATEHIEHQSQVQDLDVGELLGPIVDKEDGSYFENRYGEYIFTGKETINKNSTDTTNYLYYLYSKNVLKDMPDLTNIELYCSHLKENTLANLNNNNEEGIALSNNGALYFNINSVLVENTAIKFNAFLKELYDNGTPMKILYKLATPTYTKLTDEQQEQWNAIKAMSLYEGTTNLYTISEEGIAPIIDLNYNHVTPAPSPDRDSEVIELSGANLFNGNAPDLEANKGKYHLEGKVLANNSYTHILLHNIKPNTQYTFRGANAVGSASNIDSVLFDCYNEDGYDYRVIVQKQKQYTITTTAKCTKMYVSIPYADKDTFQLVEGKINKPYVSYGHIGLKQSGKNVLNISKLTRISTEKGLTCIYNKERNSIIMNGTITEDNATVDIAMSDIKLLNVKKDITKLFIKKLSGTIEGAGSTRLFVDGWTKSITISFNNSLDYKSVIYRQDSGYGYSCSIRFDTGVVLRDFEMQVMITDFDDTFEPYIEPKIQYINLKGNKLAKLPSRVKDNLLIGLDGKVNIGKKTDSDDLKDASWFVTADSYDNNRKRYATQLLNNKENPIKPNTLMLCNYFKSAIGFDKLFIDNYVTNPQSGAISFYSSKYSTVADWIDFVNQNDLKVLYELLNPTTIPLPSIKPIELFEGTNIFELITNLPTTLTVHYKVSSKKQLIENNDRITALEATVNTLLGGN